MAEVFGCHKGSGEFGRGQAVKAAADFLNVPRIAAGIRDDTGLGLRERLGDEGEAAIGERRARRERLPGANSHGDGANAEGRAGALAKYEGADGR